MKLSNVIVYLFVGGIVAGIVNNSHYERHGVNLTDPQLAGYCLLYPALGGMALVEIVRAEP